MRKIAFAALLGLTGCDTTPVVTDAQRAAALQAWGDCAMGGVVTLVRTSTERSDLLAIAAVSACAAPEFDYFALFGEFNTPAFRNRLHAVMIERATSLAVMRRARYPEQSPGGAGAAPALPRT